MISGLVIKEIYTEKAEYSFLYFRGVATHLWETSFWTKKTKLLNNSIFSNKLKIKELAIE